MKRTVLGTMFDFVRNNLPDAVTSSPIRMDAVQFRSIGRLSDYPRPLCFIAQQMVLGCEKLIGDISETIGESGPPEEGDDRLAHKIDEVGSLELTEKVLEALFHEALLRELPRAFDYNGPVIVTDDWQVAVPRFQSEPRCQLFSHDSLPAMFFSILCEILKGKVRYDGEPPFPPVAGMRVIGRLDKLFARQIFIMRYRLYNLKTRLRVKEYRGRGLEQWCEETTVIEALRFHKKMGRIEQQRQIAGVLLGEHIREFQPDFNEVFICEDWTLAVPS